MTTDSYRCSKFYITNNGDSFYYKCDEMSGCCLFLYPLNSLDARGCRACSMQAGCGNENFTTSIRI